MSQETMAANDMALLTDAEIAALAEDGGETTPPAEEQAEPQPEEQVSEPAEPTIGTDVVEPPLEEPEVQQEAPAAVEPTFRYPEVPMTDSVPPELATQLAVVSVKFENGEIEISEYMTERSGIERQITAFQIQEAQQQKQFNNWMDAQDSFLSANRQYADNKLLFSALDTAVREVQADPKSRFLTPMQQLSAADDLVKKSFGIFAPPEVKPVVKTEETKAAPPRQALPSVPTLASVPAAAENSTNVDPFAAIDRLTGDAREAALAKLSPEQYDAYLKA